MALNTGLVGIGGLKDKITDIQGLNATKNLYNRPTSQTISAQNTTAAKTGGGSSSSTSQNDWMSQYLAAVDARAKAQRDAKVAAIENQLQQQLKAYDEQAAGLEPVYQNYRNQSEVERYKAQRALRESLANRGALDSGAGRQETLDLHTKYGNNLNDINLQYQNELDAINRAKQALRSEADYQKIQAQSDVDNVGLSAKIEALKSQLANQSSTYRENAENSTKGKSTGSSLSKAAQQIQSRMKSSTMGIHPDAAATALSSAYKSGQINESDLKILASQFGVQVK